MWYSRSLSPQVRERGSKEFASCILMRSRMSSSKYDWVLLLLSRALRRCLLPVTLPPPHKQTRLPEQTPPLPRGTYMPSSRQDQHRTARPGKRREHDNPYPAGAFQMNSATHYVGRLCYYSFRGVSRNVAYSTRVGVLSPRASTRGWGVVTARSTYRPVPSRPMFCSGRYQPPENKPKTR